MINYNYYLTTRTEIVNRRKNDFISNYEKARNKNTVGANWIDVLRDESNLIRKEIVQYGLENFKREWDNIYELDSGVNLEKAFEDTIAHCFPNLTIEQIGLICQIDAYSELMEFIESKRIINNGNDVEVSLINNPIWIGQNETEFLQLIEGLIETRRLDPKAAGGKWKLIDSFAKFVGIELSKNAKSNLSKSKNERNKDYTPKIFEELLNYWD
jgi:hypothetical protein